MPEPDNIAYAAAGGFRFESEQFRRIGMAAVNLEDQLNVRVTRPAERLALSKLKLELENLRREIMTSRNGVP